MPIPEFDEESGYLPPGRHAASLTEIGDRFAWNFKRRELFSELRYMISKLRDCGVLSIYIDGSFTTDIPRPGDVDVVYDPNAAGVDPTCLDDKRLLLRDLDWNHDNFKMDLWPLPSYQQKIPGGPLVTILEFFESDRALVPKGIVELVGED